MEWVERFAAEIARRHGLSQGDQAQLASDLERAYVQATSCRCEPPKRPYCGICNGSGRVLPDSVTPWRPLSTRYQRPRPLYLSDRFDTQEK